MSALLQPGCHDDLLNYRLKHLASVGGAPAIQLCEGRYGVTRAEWRLLAALVEGGAVSPSMLSRNTDVEPARVSRLVTTLLAKRLVRRTEDGTDRRAAQLEATASGHKLYAELFPQLAQINRRICEVLTPAEAEVLDRCLTKLTARARSLRDEAESPVKANRRSGGSRRLWPA